MADAAPQTSPPGDEPSQQPPGGEQTFPLEYVQGLRTEAADARVKAKRSDALAARLTAAYAAQDGRLADASDLPHSDAVLDEDGLVDPAKVTAAVDALLAAKPHLASRRPASVVEQGAREAEDGFSLAALLRQGAG